MGIADDVGKGIDEVLAPPWKITNGTKVPEAADIVLRDGAVKLDATYLYADMADSTGLAQKKTKEVTAKIIRCYLNAATRLIRHRGGAVRSFDGDRVMGIFIGDSKNTSAVKAALNISWAVTKIIQPKLNAKWSELNWTMSHGVGIDTGEAFLVRGGVWGDNDIVSIGSAPNIAAKLSEKRGHKKAYVSKAIYDHMAAEAKYVKPATKEENMWEYMGAEEFGGRSVQYYGSSYHWSP